jgi:hypothetical protein
VCQIVALDKNKYNSGDFQWILKVSFAKSPKINILLIKIEINYFGAGVQNRGRRGCDSND